MSHSLIYKTGDLFAGAPSNAILAHACNARGRWGSGIALEFATRFPHAYNVYRQECFSEDTTGKGFVIFDSHAVACLITSKDYGPRVDPPESILKATYQAVCDVLRHMEAYRSNYSSREIHSPKINAGLFKVPWDDTEKVLLRALADMKTDVTWTVWELPT
jgi:ADP-ribose 1''-phosphate phosphatase